MTMGKLKFLAFQNLWVADKPAQSFYILAQIDKALCPRSKE